MVTGWFFKGWRILTSTRALTVLVAGASFLLYWRTAAPTVLPGDSGEFQFAAWGFWLAHPTGYPLYLILGGLWQHLVPLGDPAFRLNLFSGFWSALTVGIAFRVFWQTTRARGAAVIAALTFAVSPLFWSQATRAEVYALNTLFIALLTLLGLLWNETPRRRYAAAFAVVFGLSLAHHRMTILLIPAFAALFANRLLFWRAPSSGRVRVSYLGGRPVSMINTPTEIRKEFLQRALMYGVLALIPLLLYLYIPLRTGATPYATIDLTPAAPIVVFGNSARGWLGVVLGSGFSGELGIDARTGAALVNMPGQLVAQLNPVGVLTAVLGLGALLWRKQFSLLALVILGSVTFVLFNSIYHIGDIADFDTPIFFFACIALAAGIALVIQFLQSHAMTRHGILPAVALLAFLVVLPLQNLSVNFYIQDRSRDRDTRRAWETMLASNLPDNAILLSNDRDEMTPLYYLQLVEGERAGWLGVFSKIAPGPQYENVVSLVEQLALSGRPIYAIKPIPALLLRYAVEETNDGFWRVKPITIGPPQRESNAVLGEILRVRGFSLLAGERYAGEQITLGVQYEPLEKLGRDYTTSLQLWNEEGDKVAQGNDHVPGENEYPPTKWRVGQVVQDQFEIELDPLLETDIYRVMLGIYDPVSGEELGETTQIGTLRIDE
ncbi:MAG: DUF2723 domain-containing protein [Anaerolineae bacterium]|nr:DUF2723 domain-containing protein [Anaerolineae bacterium]